MPRCLDPLSITARVRRVRVPGHALLWISMRSANPGHAPLSSNGFDDAAPNVRSHTIVRLMPMEVALICSKIAAKAG